MTVTDKTRIVVAIETVLISCAQIMSAKTRVVGMSDRQLNQFVCRLCNDLFVDPVVTPCCDETYCQRCITQWLTDHNKCPNDGKRLKTHGLSSAPKLVVNFLSEMSVKCVNHEKGCQFVGRRDRMDSHLIGCQFICKSEDNDNKTSVVKITSYEPIVRRIAIDYDFDLKFKVIQVLKNGFKRDVTFIRDRKQNVFMALFDEKDIDFEIRVENNSKFNISFDLIFGNDNSIHTFVVRKGAKTSLRAVESYGRHLHFVSQTTEDGTVLVATNAANNGISYGESSINCSRLTIEVEIEKSIEEIREEKRQLKLENYRRILKELNSDRMAILVHTCDKSFRLGVRPSTSIKKIKAYILGQLGLLPNSMRFLFNGRRLKSCKTIFDYDIQHEDYIDCYQEQCGGGCYEEQPLPSDEEGEEEEDGEDERGVVCFGRKTNQTFGSYGKQFIASNKYSVKGFTLELRTKSKYSLK